MNHCVPEFNMDDNEDYSLPSPSALPGHNNNVQQDAIMELLWRNGQVVVQTQSAFARPPPTKFQHHHHSQSASPPPPTSNSTPQVSMQEEEIISWLQYPLEDPPFGRDLNDLLYHPPVPPSSTPAAQLRPPPIPIPSRPEVLPRGHNFPYFSRMADRFPDSRKNDLRESTVVDSSDTPAVDRESKVNLNAVEAYDAENRGCNSFSESGEGTVGGTSTFGAGCMSISMSRGGDTCELLLSSSPDGSSASDTADLPPVADRKRKGREPVDDATTEYQSEDVEIESYEEKKQASRGNTKRSRAAEVHNLSERRRRDKINEKMKALQDLIPRSSKTDKASMLEEAIEYLKSLQMQVQMMSMGCGMVPMMFPGVQQYMPSMAMGMGMGMMPFPSVHMNPRFPSQAFPIQQPINQVDASVNAHRMPGHNVATIPNPPQPYQQDIGVQRMPVPLQIPQIQPTQPVARQESTSIGDQDDENPQSG